jgi:hypothetical protein
MVGARVATALKTDAPDVRGPARATGRVQTCVSGISSKTSAPTLRATSLPERQPPRVLPAEPWETLPGQSAPSRL